MKCVETRRDMFAFLDGEVSVERNLEVLHHVNLCPPCGRRFEAEKRFEEGFDRVLATEAPPTGLRARLGAALEREEADASGPGPAAPRSARRVPRLPGGRRGFLAAAAALLAAVFLASDYLCLGPFQCPLLVAATEAAAGLEQGKGSATAAPLERAPDLSTEGLRKIACCERVATPTLGMDWTAAEYACPGGRVCLVTTEVGDHDPKSWNRVEDPAGRAWWEATVGGYRVRSWKEGGLLRALVTRSPAFDLDRLAGSLRGR